ncbi:hypothetical protein TI05_00770 [Achromatium sp. WMS3]|nr:hypothetical protein TI05_00770 [Achromatium sp. WMS3]
MALLLVLFWPSSRQQHEPTNKTSQQNAHNSQNSALHNKPQINNRSYPGANNPQQYSYPSNQYPYSNMPQAPYGRDYTQPWLYNTPQNRDPYAQQPYLQQPYTQQPYTQQPYAQQPYAQQPYAQQPYVQQPNTWQYPQYYNAPRYRFRDPNKIEEPQEPQEPQEDTTAKKRNQSNTPARYSPPNIFDDLNNPYGLLYNPYSTIPYNSYDPYSLWPNYNTPQYDNGNSNPATNPYHLP